MSPQKRTKSQNGSARGSTARRPARRKPYGERHIIGFLFGVGFLATLLLAGLLGAMVALKIPDIRTVAHYRPAQTSFIYDREGRVLERIFRENRVVVPLSVMPELLPKAFVAAEDGRFYDHPGLDFFSVLRAAFINIKRGGRAHGGSTITQQVARSLLLGREKTYLRKFKEAILAWRIDLLLSKEDILYIYLNQIYLGGGAYGVEAASQVYFGKHVHELGLGEMAMLAGLPQAPSRYSPLEHPELAIKRQRYVLNRMVADGYIPADRAREAFERGVAIAPAGGRESLEAGYYTAVVKKRLQRIVGLPLDRAGLRIHTHLDPKLQAAAVKALRDGVMATSGRQARLGPDDDQAAPQAALVSIETCSSRVRALLGGTDFAQSPYDRAAVARRPAGSAFKPIVFAAALEEGWQPQSTILDAPLSIPGGEAGSWTPRNYSGRYHGQVTLSAALSHSYNTAAVRLLRRVGLNPVHELSRSLGISSEMPGDLSLALGSVDVSLLELTAAYTAFVCDGVYAPPVFIDRVIGPTGAVLHQGESEGGRVLAPRTAAALRTMLARVVEEGTGSRARGLPGESGGKTGTSDDLRDAWFIGYNGGRVAGVWVGHDRNESLGPGENGGRTAAPIWYDYMRAADGSR